MIKFKKVISIGILTSTLALTLVSCGSDTENVKETTPTESKSDYSKEATETEQVETKPTEAKPVEVETPQSKTLEVEEETPTDPSETVSQTQAVRKAESYIDYKGFSREGLIGQLEYSGFSNEDATYAVDNITVDWNEQAVRAAQSYLDYKAFSRDGLIGQLEYSGFTNEQATHGADAMGL